MTVVYNDTCPICSREVEGYKHMTDAEDVDVEYVGLSSGRAAEFGLDQEAAARRFHVVTEGARLSGVDAFAALWSRLPKLRWLSRIVTLPVIHRLAELVYDHVAAPALFVMHRRRQRRRSNTQSS